MKINNFEKIIAAAAASLFILGGCGDSNTAVPKETSDVTSINIINASSTGGEVQNEYEQITQEAAAELMKQDGVIILDVRTQEEYAEGHIPGAICIPNETIEDKMPSQLPDLQQIILVYCRSGRRSKEASQKLADIGYTNIKEFGGIIDWTGKVVTDKPEITEAVSVEYAENVPDITDFVEKVIDDSEYSVNAMFTANETVSDFMISSLYMESIDDNGKPTYVTNELYNHGTLEAGRSVKFIVSFPGDMPNYQISFIDKNGNMKKYTLGQSGRDGSLVMGEIDD